MSLRDACMLCFLESCCIYNSSLQFLESWSASLFFFTRHCRLHWIFKLSRCFFDGFFIFTIFRNNEINASQSCRALSSFGFSTARFRRAGPDFRPQIIKSGSCLIFCKPLPGPRISFGRFFVQQCEHRESCAWIWQISIHIDIPMVVNTGFLQQIQICTSSRARFNVFQWDWECFFFRHVELNWRFNVMTINEVTFDWPEVFPGFSVIFCFCRLRFFRDALKSSSPYKLFPPTSGFSDSVVSSKQFSCSICGLESESVPPLCGVNTSVALSLRGWISDVSRLSITSMSAIIMCPFQVSRDQHVFEEYSK